MKKLLFALILVTPLAAQSGPPTTAIDPTTQIWWPWATGSGAPTASCTTAKYGQPYTDVAANPNVNYTCGAHGWAVTGDGQSAYCPFVTAYGAACNGSGDDSAAIQAAMDANSCIQFPISTSASGQKQCWVASGLVQHNAHLTIHGNGTLLYLNGTATALIANDHTGGSLWDLDIDNIGLDSNGSSGTPADIDASGYSGISLYGIDDVGGPAGYFFLNAISNGWGRVSIENSFTEGNINLQTHAGDSFSGLNSVLGPTVNIIASVGAGNYSGVSLNGIVGPSTLNLTGTKAATFANANFGSVNLGSLTQVSGALNATSLTGTAASGQLCYTISAANPVCQNYGLTVTALPTSCSGLATGTLYNNSGTPDFCP